MLPLHVSNISIVAHYKCKGRVWPNCNFSAQYQGRTGQLACEAEGGARVLRAGPPAAGTGAARTAAARGVAVGRMDLITRPQVRV